MTLKEQLDAYGAQARAKRPPEWQAIIDRATEDLRRSGIVDRSLKAGDQAPEFALSGATGKTVRSADLLARGHLVISFYRGGWWPYCNLELAALQQVLPEITAAGGSLVAISPELPDHTLTTAQKNALAFEALSDLGNTVARQFGLVFEFPPDLCELYKNGFKNDLAARNGMKTYELPIPATYVVSRDGIIRLASVDPDYTRRLEPADIIRMLRTANAGS